MQTHLAHVRTGIKLETGPMGYVGMLYSPLVSLLLTRKKQEQSSLYPYPPRFGQPFRIPPACLIRAGFEERFMYKQTRHVSFAVVEP